MLPNPYLILGAVIALGLISGGAYLKGRNDGRAVEFAERATLDEVARVAAESSERAAAQAIATIKPIHTTIRQQAETVIRESKVYVECVNPDDIVRLLDAARANRAPEPASDSGVPGAGTSPAQDVR